MSVSISGGLRVGLGGISGGIGISGSIGGITGSLSGGLSLGASFGIGSLHLGSMVGSACIQGRTITGQGITTVISDCILEETGRDDLQITEHPVEQGSVIADHAYMKPREVTLKWSWSNSSGHGTGFVQSMYQTLLTVQKARTPFTIYTGKCAYKNMLIASLGVTTNSTAEYVLNTVMVCREVILVSTTAVAPSQAAQADPSKTAAVTPKGAVAPQNAGAVQQPVAPSSPSSNVAGVSGAPGTQSGPSAASASPTLLPGPQAVVDQTQVQAGVPQVTVPPAESQSIYGNPNQVLPIPGL